MFMNSFKIKLCILNFHRLSDKTIAWVAGVNSKLILYWFFKFIIA